MSVVSVSESLLLLELSLELKEFDDEVSLEDEALVMGLFYGKDSSSFYEYKLDLYQGL